MICPNRQFPARARRRPPRIVSLEQWKASTPPVFNTLMIAVRRIVRPGLEMPSAMAFPESRSMRPAIDQLECHDEAAFYRAGHHDFNRCIVGGQTDLAHLRTSAGPAAVFDEPGDELPLDVAAADRLRRGATLRDACGPRPDRRREAPSARRGEAWRNAWESCRSGSPGRSSRRRVSPCEPTSTGCKFFGRLAANSRQFSFSSQIRKPKMPGVQGDDRGTS